MTETKSALTSIPQKIFLSYSTDDKSFVHSVETNLAACGFNVFWDRNIAVKERWKNILEQQLAAADSVLVLWTPNSVNSPWVLAEAAIGKQRNRLVQARLLDCKIPDPFSGEQVADLTDFEILGRKHPEFVDMVEVIKSLGSSDSESGVKKNDVSSIARAVSISVWILAICALLIGTFLFSTGKYIGLNPVGLVYPDKTLVGMWRQEMELSRGKKETIGLLNISSQHPGKFIGIYMYCTTTTERPVYGVIQGMTDSGLLKGSWENVIGQTGTFQFTLNSDNNSFTGNYRIPPIDHDYNWLATRISNQPNLNINDFCKEKLSPTP